MIVPTLDRPYFIQRSVKFWSEGGVKVIVVEGSENKTNVGNALSAESRTNITHIHLPHSSIEHRLMTARFDVVVRISLAH